MNGRLSLPGKHHISPKQPSDAGPAEAAAAAADKRAVVAAPASHLEAANAALQSINEELGKSRDRLQSANEELSSLNRELQLKIRQLEVANADLRNSFESSEAATICLDREQRVKWFSGSMSKLCNMAPSDVGRPISERTLKELGQDLARAATAVLDGRGADVQELKAGDGRWYVRRLSPYRGENQKIEGVLVSYIDITESKRAAEAAIEQREWLQTTFTSIGEALITTDIGGRVNYLNPAAVSLTGWQLGTAKDRPLPEVFRIVHERTGEPAADAVASALREGCVSELIRDTLLIARDGREYPIEHRAAPICDKSGQVRGAILTFRDVSLQRQAAEALEASEVRYRRLFEAATDGILLLDGNTGRVTGANPQMCSLLDCSREELIGSALWEIGIFPSEDESRRAFRSLQEKGFIHYPNLPQKAANGRCWDAELTCNAYVSRGKWLMQCHMRDISERQRAQRRILQLNLELKRRADELQTIFDTVPAGILVAYERECIHIHCNKYLQSLLGVAGEVFAATPGQPLPYRLLRGGRELAVEELPLRRAADSGEPIWNQECELLVDGRPPVHVLVSAMPLLDEAGMPRGAVATVQDISERQRAEQALKKSEQQYRSLIEISPQGVWLVSRSGRLLYCNPHWRDYSGLRWDEKGPLWTEQLHPEEREQAWLAWQRALAAGVTFEAELRLRRAMDGQYRWHLVRGVSLGEDGEGEGKAQAEGTWLGVVVDIHRRKEAESAMAQLAAIVQSSSDAIVGRDLAGIITSWNVGAERLYGYAAQEAVKKPVAMLIPDDHQDEEPAILAKICRGEQIPSLETVRRHKDGHLIDVALTISPIKDPSGRVIGASKVARDISDRRRAERANAELLAREKILRLAAEAASRAKDDFLATLSHELRTPMNAILGWIQTLSAGRADRATLTRALRAMEQSAKAQAKLIEDILNVSDIIAGRLRLEVKPLSLSAVIGDAIESVRPAIAAKDIYFSCQFDAAADHLTGDAARIQQIVWNLLANAVKFTPNGGEVRLTTARRHAHAEIIVEDNGEGIGPEFLPYVFDRFRQADASSKRRHGGLGLGLAIVRHLTELHGGAVEVDSAGIGNGARFTVRLPLRAPAAAVAHQASASAVPAPVAAPPEPAPVAWRQRLVGLRILSVDDDDNTREMLEEALERAGAEVLSAASAAQALSALARFRPDVLISDIGLPDEDGYDLLRAVRRLPAEAGGAIPAVALSGYASDHDRLAAERAGYQAFATKPIVLAELIATVIRLARPAAAAETH